MYCRGSGSATPLTSTYVDGWLVGFGGATTATFGAVVWLGAVATGTLGAELASGWLVTAGWAGEAGTGAAEEGGGDDAEAGGGDDAEALGEDALPWLFGTATVGGAARTSAACAEALDAVDALAGAPVPTSAGDISRTGARNIIAHIWVSTEPVAARPLWRS